MPFNWLCQCFWPDRHNRSSESRVAAEGRHQVLLDVYVYLSLLRRHLQAALNALVCLNDAAVRCAGRQILKKPRDLHLHHLSCFVALWQRAPLWGSH